MKRSNDLVQRDTTDGDNGKRPRVSPYNRNNHNQQYAMTFPATPVYMGDYGANQMMMLNSGSLFNGEMNRTVYLGGIPKGTTANEIFNNVKTGAVESLRMVPEKGCAFLSFVEPLSASLLFKELSKRLLRLQGQDIKIGWGKPSSISPIVKQALRVGATRNVYIGHLKDEMTEDYLRSHLEPYGEIEQVKVVQDKKIGFVHFINVSSAYRCVCALSSDLQWTGHRIFYGKDRCAFAKDSMPFQQQQQIHQQLQLQLQLQQQQQQQQQQLQQQPFQYQNAQPFNVDVDGQPQFGMDPYALASLMAVHGNNNANIKTSVPIVPGNEQQQTVPRLSGWCSRTIYLGNLTDNTTVENICNTIACGRIYRIKQIKEKNSAFVTYVDPESAQAAYDHGTTIGFPINGRRAKIGWGKDTGIPYTTVLAIEQGASRVIYVGGVEQEMTEEQVRRDFDRYGEIEHVRILPLKHCMFVSFSNINAAMQAISGIQTNPAYTNYKINYGKDRCDHPPKAYTPKPKEGERPAALSQLTAKKSEVIGKPPAPVLAQNYTDQWTAVRKFKEKRERVLALKQLTYDYDPSVDGI